MMLPNFLIIGTPKAGSTTVYHYLSEHPQVFMSVPKEPCFFSYGPDGPSRDDAAHLRRWQNAVKRREDYEALFAGVRGETAVGEASVNYLAAEGAAERIHKTLPHAKLIAILRNPADRAYSAYWMDVRKGYERRPFAETIAENLAEDDPTRRYVEEGYYHSQLAKYDEFFPPEQIRVYLLEDLQRHPIETMQDLYAFLGVDAAFVPDTRQTHNQGGLPKWPAVDRLLFRGWFKQLVPRALSQPARRLAGCIRGWNRKSTAPLDPESRRRLESLFSEEIRRLEQRLGRDLSHWTSSVSSLETTTGSIAR